MRKREEEEEEKVGGGSSPGRGSSPGPGSCPGPGFPGQGRRVLQLLTSPQVLDSQVVSYLKKFIRNLQNRQHRAPSENKPEPSENLGGTKMEPSHQTVRNL
ncbi:hypothetical protein F2P81_019724 [Scophthalmus maximus]|uniref:Uncharacterized protein n=1 Tax=Scophthalmus maximus TaxID=52904 RepID=A0A6A4S6C9_SCOMX|nr:hypothetical protein F2P81_019724 [Scophthalmus maximus]